MYASNSETLTFIESIDHYSVYRTVNDGRVYLAHGRPARRLVPFDDLPLRTLRDRTIAEHGYFDIDNFRDLLRSLTVDRWAVNDVLTCEDCGDPGHMEDLFSTGDGTTVCKECYFDDYYQCECCGERFSETTTTLYDSEVCSRCRARDYTYCEDCDGWRSDTDDAHDHGTDCDCEPVGVEFTVRDGHAVLPNDTRTTITLPAGEITEVGICQIAQMLRAWAPMDYNFDTSGPEWAHSVNVHNISYRFHEEVGATWQTKGGNFTKRLSRFAYNEHKIKLPSDLLSEIGNVARAHSTPVDFEVEVTRQLNGYPGDFAHAGSCWWTEYNSSRCALKSNGGFALRSFHPEHGYVTGRAWVMPLRKTPDSSFEPMHNGALVPTFETQEPDAFVVFNGYEALDGYRPARIVAHMAGWTYRKIEFTSSPMFINGSTGYLVAPEEIATRYSDHGALAFDLVEHSSLYLNEQRTLTNA